MTCLAFILLALLGHQFLAKMYIGAKFNGHIAPFFPAHLSPVRNELRFSRLASCTFRDIFFIFHLGTQKESVMGRKYPGTETHSV